MADHDFKIGDAVVLFRLDNWFFDGLPEMDVRFLKTCIGRPTEIIGFGEYGHAELEWVVTKAERARGHSTYSHTVWVTTDWIEKV